MVNIDIGIDLGTSNTVIYIKDKGIVVNQPSVVAYEAKSKKIIAVGNKAKKMLGKTPEDIEVTRPIRNGVISDYIMTERMLKIYVKSAIAKRKIWGKPNICVCVPSGVTDVQRRAACDAVYRTGAKNVYVLEEPFAAAIGAGVDIESAVGAMVVDIGAGTTDIAIVARGGVQHSSSIKIGGDDFDEAIIRYVRKKHNLLIGERTAEDIKINIGTAIERPDQKVMEVRGRDLVTGLPKTVRVTSEETRDALKETTSQIVEAVHGVLERTPPELAADVVDRGIVLTGGGSLLGGLEELIEEKTGINTVTAEDPMTAVAIGTGKFVELTAGNGKLIE